MYMPRLYFSRCHTWCDDSRSGHAANLTQENLSCKSCEKQELHLRAAVQNGLAGIYEDVSNELGVYSKCTCPGFPPPDATLGVMTRQVATERCELNSGEFVIQVLRGTGIAPACSCAEQVHGHLYGHLQ